MAQWWELAIPAGGTLIGTLSAGWLGAVYQRRNSERLLDRQAQESERARLATSKEAEKVRNFEAEKEREARNHGERKQAYIGLWQALYDEERLTGKQRRLADQYQALKSQSDADADALNKAHQEFTKATENLIEAKEAAIGALTSLLFCAPSCMHSIATNMRRARLAMDEKERERWQAIFTVVANYDLNSSHSQEDTNKHYKKILLALEDDEQTPPASR
ncbi:hypothetical protein [Micromonospora sp. CMU55-4]|uniref:hypothetical protein n=1 Tax=Micromonospora sp. CMU55-4 TaxID=2717028 RepID=UPI00140988A1|nr:hypothetical protein [Micromonospora sp. CMU55-4]NHO83467.1 hypothetical protein [Micromonospora sp. CMU55-4]